MATKKIVVTSLAILAITAWYCSPILKPFPALTGSYQVGIQTLELADHQRPEPFADNPTDKRTLMAHLFYPASLNPADTSGNQQAEPYPYLGNKMPRFQKAFADHYHLPQLVSKLLWRNIHTNAYLNAPLATGNTKYPVILFSHGLLGFPSDMYVSILEDLASHGYIVIGIDHPYFNILTLYPNGRIVSSQKLDEQFQKMRPADQKEFQNKAIAIYKEDMQFILGQLATLNEDQSSIFYHHLDLDRVGVMGHSAGGTAAIEFCRIDKRCKAGVDLDGWYDQAIGHEPLQQPLLLMFGSKSLEVTEPSTEYLKRKELTRERYYEREQNIADHKKELCKNKNCSMIIILEANHTDFSDEALLKWPLRPWNAVNGYKAMAEINGHILNFFDRYLQAKNIRQLLIDEEYDDQLRLKLAEEAAEVGEAKSHDELIEKLADIFEVILA